MKLCIPVEHYEGLKSLVSGHFGSAPLFVVVDTETSEVSEIANLDLNHLPGTCNPLKALHTMSVDAIIAGGIGAGALNSLSQAGIKAFKALGVTVADNITCLGMDMLPELFPNQVCSEQNHGCSP